MKIVAVIAGSSAVFASALLVAGCDGSVVSGAAGGRPTPLTLGKEYRAMKAAARAATSVHVSGTVVQDGKVTSLDMAFVKPSSAAGAVTSGGASWVVVLTPSQSYVKISKQFLRATKLSAGLCAKVCGKYLEFSPSSIPSLTGLTMSGLISTVFKPLIKAEAAIRLTADQYEGQAAWSGQGNAESIYIAKGGPPYLLAVSQSGNYLSFSDWNTATVSPPPARRVLTAAQLRALAAG